MIGKNTKVVDLKGRMVMPGIIDSHIHAVRGGLGQLYFCQFPVESSVAQIQAAVKQCVAKKKKGEWLEGKTWDSGLSKNVTAAMLDKGRLDAYRAMEKDGDLTIRLQGSWDFNTRYATEPIDKMAERFATREKRGPVTDLINPDGIKIYADGVWIGYGSPFIDMYETGESYGRQSIDQPTMKTWVTRFDKEGLKVMIHAVGDQAVRLHPASSS